MENTRYDYSPIISRKPFKLPNNARVAFWVIINVEYFDIGATEGGGKKFAPDLIHYSTRDYGPRVGIWRLMELLDRYNIKATVALNSDVCSHYPIIIEEGKKRGWEFMGHGTSNSILLSGLSESDERNMISTSLDVLTKAVGQRPKGWRSPGMAETFNTPDILAEEGIEYVCDWYNDDQPYPMKVKKGRLISLPSFIGAGDGQAFNRQYASPEQFYKNVTAEFDTLYKEGINQARVLSLSCHPFLSALPFRIGWLDKALQHIKSHKDVWFATGWEIADWYYKEYLNEK